MAYEDDLQLGQYIPNIPQIQAVGDISGKIERGTTEFAELIRNDNSDIIFTVCDQSGLADDHRYMTPKLCDRLNLLAALVKQEWGGEGVKLTVTAAWDESGHRTNSIHYEGRAVDLQTAPKDSMKLGRLGRLAVNAGFEWVFYEDQNHIHASVSAEDEIDEGPVSEAWQR